MYKYKKKQIPKNRDISLFKIMNIIYKSTLTQVMGKTRSMKRCYVKLWIIVFN